MRHYLDNQSFIEWLRSQPPEKTYNYQNCNNCLIAQYFCHIGFRNVHVIPYQYSINDKPFKPLPLYWEEIANGVAVGPNKFQYTTASTFGGALERAEYLLENILPDNKPVPAPRYRAMSWLF